MNIDNKHFYKFDFTTEQISQHFNNAWKDLDIANKDEILDVKFNYAYTAFIKAGITLLSFYGMKVRSIPGHHVKIIDKIAQSLDDCAIADMGNIMRSKRNSDIYAGGIEITEKECKEYIRFVENVVTRVREIIFQKE
ncbi:MAG: orotidine 5'-phosphate decarboxylase [Candidatus Omnitrophica bacterium]|nr:orotidine 5'-phosphate decarboxylase [Candidatus Omnitrophota bacterium]